MTLSCVHHLESTGLCFLHCLSFVLPALFVVLSFLTGPNHFLLDQLLYFIMSPLHDGESQSFALLEQIQKSLDTIQQDYRTLAAAVDTINGRVNVLAGVKEVHDAASQNHANKDGVAKVLAVQDCGHPNDVSIHRLETPHVESTQDSNREPASATSPPRSSPISRIILTTYPGQSGIDPLSMSWGHQDPIQRGPVVVSRSQSTLRRRNGASSN